MNPVFLEFIQLQLYKGLTRNLRNEKINELIVSADVSYIEIDELVSFEKELEKLKLSFTFPFFEKIYFPVLEKGFLAENLSAIKLLIQHISIVYFIERKRQTEKYSLLELIEKGLLSCPTDRELLEKKESLLESYLDFSIHEVPSIVLYGNNGASQSQCQELLETLAEYKQLCEQLGIDREELINECDFHFRHYWQYLDARQEYASYAEYLQKNASW